MADFNGARKVPHVVDSRPDQNVVELLGHGSGALGGNAAMRLHDAVVLILHVVEAAAPALGRFSPAAAAVQGSLRRLPDVRVVVLTQSRCQLGKIILAYQQQAIGHILTHLPLRIFSQQLQERGELVPRARTIQLVGHSFHQRSALGPARWNGG
jgi:hypothetical protein